MTPSGYATRLLRSLGQGGRRPAVDDRDAAALWRDSGAMWLTGEADGPPLACAAPVASAMQGAWLALATLFPERLDPGFDASRMLGERAATMGHARRGRVSPGGACGLFEAADGWLALNLPRPEDLELLPAWLEVPDAGIGDLAAELRGRGTGALVARGRLMGLAVADLPASAPATAPWFRSIRLAPRAGNRRRAPLVLDLGALWAGPLCTSILGDCGARVIKIESRSRPDGARHGPKPFFDLLNGGKQSVVLPLDTAPGRAALRGLIEAADIIVEGSRPRALEHMGIIANDIAARGDGKVWVSITGYGREPGQRDWIAFGDDAGAAAGLSPRTVNSPVFCADAVADPLAGLHAALAAMNSWLAGGGELLDVSLYSVARYVAALAEPAAGKSVGEALPPRSRPVRAPAAALGADTQAVLVEFGLAAALAQKTAA